MCVWLFIGPFLNKVLHSHKINKITKMLDFEDKKKVGIDLDETLI